MKIWKIIGTIMLDAGCFGVGWFVGDAIQKKRIAHIQDQLKDLKTANEILNNGLAELEKDLTKQRNDIRYPLVVESPEKVLKAYIGTEPDPEKPATDEDPDMVEETPKIGDEETVEQSPSIEFITEQEYYNSSDGCAQEQMIWYSLDEILWNRDTNSVVTVPDIHKSIGYGTLDIFDKENSDDSLFVRNNILMVKFRIDRMDSAWCDEHGDTYEDDR